jgi:hypothetical protein
MASNAQSRAVAGDNGIHESSLRCMALTFLVVRLGIVAVVEPRRDQERREGAGFARREGYLSRASRLPVSVGTSPRLARPAAGGRPLVRRPQLQP